MANHEAWRQQPLDHGDLVLIVTPSGFAGCATVQTVTELKVVVQNAKGRRFTFRRSLNCLMRLNPSAVDRQKMIIGDQGLIDKLKRK